MVLADRSSAPPLARQVLQLLMDQSGGSLPLMELCSRYRTTFGVDPDLSKIKEELLDYVQVSVIIFSSPEPKAQGELF